VTATPTAAQQFQRAVRGLPFEAVYTFGLDDDAPPDSAPTYTVVNAEGSTIATGTASLITSDPIEASFVLTAAELPLRDLLTVTWTYTVSAAPTATVSLVDVCDKRLFPMSDYATIFSPADLASYSTTQLEQARREAEDFVEEQCGTAFTGRYGSELHLIGHHRKGYWDGYGYGGGGYGYGPGFGHSAGTNRLALRRPHVLVLRSIVRNWVDPADADSGVYTYDLNYAQLDTFSSTVHYHSNPTQWGSSLWGDLIVSYEYGQWVADVRRICLILARYRLLNGPLERRAVSMTLEGGGSVQLLTPGMAASVTGIPEVDSFIQRWNQRADGFFA
jgi:hypothetical protein